MKSEIRSFIIIFVIATILLTVPVGAALNTIPAGGTVFIGEQGLDVSAAITAGTAIGWWASGVPINITSPSYQMVVSDATRFYVDPALFGSRTGNWYKISDNTPAINVKDPYLSIRVYDVTVDTDVTGKWIPWEDEVKFEIDTNLYEMSSRTGISGAPITIKIQSPQGAVYSSVVNKSRFTNNLVEISVGTTPYYTVPMWDTGNGSYSPGTYQIWAECNANNMKDNYYIVGKTITNQGGGSIRLQDVNPNIRQTTQTTISTTAPTIAPTMQTATPATPISTTITTPLPTAPPTITIVTMPSLTTDSLPPASTGSSPAPTRSAGFNAVLIVLALGGALWCGTTRRNDKN
jgi:hypothetical protein